MIGRLNHVAIAVPDLDAAAAQYRTMLGANVGAPQDEPDHGVTVIFIELPNTKIELLYPLGEGSPIAGFLEKNPSGGIHHICYEVDDILGLEKIIFCDSFYEYRYALRMAVMEEQAVQQYTKEIGMQLGNFIFLCIHSRCGER